MKMKKLGRTDVQVSEICLGTMTWGKQNSEADGHAQMDYAITQGINFFDTAEMYAVPPDASTYGKTEERAERPAGRRAPSDKTSREMRRLDAADHGAKPYRKDDDETPRRQVRVERFDGAEKRAPRTIRGRLRTRATVSWTRSSASSREPHSAHAARYIESTWSPRDAGSSRRTGVSA